MQLFVLAFLLGTMAVVRDVASDKAEALYPEPVPASDGGPGRASADTHSPHDHGYRRGRSAEEVGDHLTWQATGIKLKEPQCVVSRTV